MGDQLTRCRGRLGFADDSMPLSFWFHKPPYTTIDHLHLHCLLQPFDENKAWYRSGTKWCCSFQGLMMRLLAHATRHGLLGPHRKADVLDLNYDAGIMCKL